MKPHGAKFEYEQQRNEDLMRAYQELVRESKCITTNIYRKIVDMPSLRFWVSPERAAIVIASIMKGDKLSYMRNNKREMFGEIYKRAMEIRKKLPNLTILETASIVVEQPAPKFYLTPGYAEIIVGKIKKQCYERTKQRLRHLF